MLCIYMPLTLGGLLLISNRVVNIPPVPRQEDALEREAGLSRDNSWEQTSALPTWTMLKRSFMCNDYRPEL